MVYLQHGCSTRVDTLLKVSVVDVVWRWWYYTHVHIDGIYRVAPRFDRVVQSKVVVVNSKLLGRAKLIDLYDTRLTKKYTQVR